MEQNIFMKGKTGLNPNFQVKYKISIPKINLTEMPIFSTTNENVTDSHTHKYPPKYQQRLTCQYHGYSVNQAYPFLHIKKHVQ